MAGDESIHFVMLRAGADTPMYESLRASRNGLAVITFRGCSIVALDAFTPDSEPSVRDRGRGCDC